jgi:hypothetical protein
MTGPTLERDAVLSCYNGARYENASPVADVWHGAVAREMLDEQRRIASRSSRDNLSP